MRSNNKILWEYYLQLDVWDYDDFFIHDSFIFHHSKRNEGFNYIIGIVVKIFMSPLLDKNDKDTTPFTFSKIYSINVQNNINKSKTMITCIAAIFT